MKIIFFGTSRLAASILEALFLSKHKVKAVVTTPDKKRGRGQKIAFSPVKLFAQKKGLTILQPTDLEDKAFLQILRNFSVDLLVVCAYGKMLTKEVLQIPQIYAINLHTSLLPKYRGAAPINWALIKGERKTGVTIFRMNEYMDQGEIILQKKIDISLTDNALSLTQRLAELGAKTLLEAIDLIVQQKVTFVAQDENQVSYAPKLRKKDGLINWQTSALEIHNRIRGLQPWPSAFTYLNNKLLKIWQSKVIESKNNAQPGEILEIDTQKGILVQTSKHILLITELQLEGKKKMSVTEFILGHKIEVGQKLGQQVQ
jgi:methionyl-tRNA formyltransferase